MSCHRLGQRIEHSNKIHVEWRKDDLCSDSRAARELAGARTKVRRSDSAKRGRLVGRVEHSYHTNLGGSKVHVGANSNRIPKGLAVVA